MALPDNLRRLRQGRYTQEGLARALDITLSTYVNWERGRSEPRASDLKRLADALEVSTDQLLDRVPA